MANIRLHKMVGIFDDIVFIQIGRTHRTRRIDTAPPPDGFGIVLDDNALMRIKRPAIITGKPGHIGWIDDNQAIDVFCHHRRAGFIEATGVFLQAEI